MEGFRVRSKIGKHKCRDGEGLFAPVRELSYKWTEFANYPPDLLPNTHDIEPVKNLSAATVRSIKQSEEDKELAALLREKGGEQFQRQNMATIRDYIRNNREKALKAKESIAFFAPEIADLGKSKTTKDTVRVAVDSQGETKVQTKTE